MPVEYDAQLIMMHMYSYEISVFQCVNELMETDRSADYLVELRSLTREERRGPRDSL